MLTTINKDNMNDMNKPIGNVMPNQPGTGNQALYDGPMKQYSDQLNQASNFSQGMMMKSPLKELSSEALVSPFKINESSSSPLEGNAFGQAMADTGGDYEQAQNLLKNQ